MSAPRHLVLVSDAPATCGVEAFTRLAAVRLGARGETHVLDLAVARLRRSLRRTDGIVLNFPVVAWKKKLVEPLLAALLARMMGKAVTVVLHEWTDLDWKRRLVIAPVCLLATAFLFSAPEVAAQFTASPLARLASRRHAVIPIPPNLIAAPRAAGTPIAEALRAERRKGRLILGQFGSIYPKKQSARVLAVAAELVAAGQDVFVVFAGSFIKGGDSVEADFYRDVEALGLRERVLVTGYIADAAALAGVFGEIDAFVYVFPEGLTVRRASVLTAALSGKPVIVNAPAGREALARHPLFAALIGDHSIRLAPNGASAKLLARMVLESLARRGGQIDPDAAIADLWTVLVASLDQAAGVPAGVVAQQHGSAVPAGNALRRPTQVGSE